MKDLIIIGGGPAGMTAAVYAARKKMDTLLFAREIGGQVVTTWGIENYMGYQFIEGTELIRRFEEQVKQFPLEQKIGDEVIGLKKIENGFEVLTGEGESLLARAVIIATGKKPRRLDVPGESGLLGRGVSYCAVCDGPLFNGENVAVIGGGNSALEALDDMLKIARKVYSVTVKSFTGDAVLVERIRQDARLTLLPGTEVLAIQGAERVEGLEVRNIKTRETQKLEVHGVFIEIGLRPNSEFARSITALNSTGEIEVNCRCETQVPGLYAAGDVASTPEKQIIIAAGEGAKAALQAHRYLQRLNQGDQKSGRSS